MHDGGGAGEEVVLFLLGFEAGVELAGDVLLEGVEDSRTGAGGDVVAHGNAEAVEVLPLAVEGEEGADLEEAGGDVEDAGDLGPVLEVAESFPIGLAVVHDEAFAAGFGALGHARRLAGGGAEREGKKGRGVPMADCRLRRGGEGGRGIDE